MPDVKGALKAVRGWGPLNSAATSAARSVLRVFGREAPFLVRHLPRVGRVEDRLPNGRSLVLMSRGDDWVSNQVFWKGWRGYESETIELFYRMAERAETTIDVGAYVGFFSLIAAHANPAGRVVAFEPHPGMYARLLRHVSLNGLTNVECVQAAVGSREGTATLLHAASGLPCSSSLSEAFMAPHADVARSEVPLVTLDGSLERAGNPRVGLMKLDTESTEPDVLRGAAGVLARDRPLVVCEVLAGAGTGEALAANLRPLEYRFFLLTPDGPRETPTIEGHPTWLNYLFAPASVDVGRL
jgi:FkbM family methyltransferase